MQTIDQIRVMNNAGVSYFNFGTQRDGRKKLFDWYMTDKLTGEQVAQLQRHGATVRGTRSEYAPEIQRAIVCFPKGWRKA